MASRREGPWRISTQGAQPRSADRRKAVSFEFVDVAFAPAEHVLRVVGSFRGTA